jgi:hypothetical protein
MAQAAYNVCVITSKDRINKAVSWCRKAVELRPQDPKYVVTLAFYFKRKYTLKRERDEALMTLKAIIEK